MESRGIHLRETIAHILPNTGAGPAVDRWKTVPESGGERNSVLEGILNGDIKLPSPPAVGIRILEAIRNEQVSLGDLVRIISADPALALKVLKIASSPAYARSARIMTLKQAIAVLGVNALKNIALCFVLVDGLCPNSKARHEFDAFWCRSITAATATESIAGLLRVRKEDLFISALLQDIGLVICHMHLAKEIQESPTGNRCSPFLVHKEDMDGFCHQEIGYLLLKQWGLPETVCDLVHNHHSLFDVPAELLPKLTILHLGNMLSSLFHTEDSGKRLEAFTNALRGSYQVTDGEIEGLMSSVHEKTSEILSFFAMDLNSMKTSAQILQEANEELGRLNFTYEQMVFELKEAREKAEDLARELAEANRALREVAYRDGLTGLFNHGHFQELLDKELVRASRYGRPLSLIMFDLDHFKKINDRFGHPAGDKVLHGIGSLALSNVRSSDAVARYGGEEFAIILPETDSRGAVKLAERIRQGVESAKISVDGRSIKVTISIGIATYCSERSNDLKSFLIAAADRALYESKSKGRNTITMARFTTHED